MPPLPAKRVPGKRAFLIDTDTASDDAVALIMALRAPDVNVVAITTVAGNVPVAQGSTNALYTAELCGSNVPVFQGADRPLLREYVTAQWFHGRDGLGDHNYPKPRRGVEPVHAVEAIIAAVESNPGITIVTLAPLTNLALALRKAPEIVRNVGRCVVMGGNPCCEGNITPAAEFNVYVDPEAAAIVLRSGMPVELVGWQLSRGEAALQPAEIDHVLRMGTTLGRFAVECNSTAMEAYKTQTGEIAICLPDPVAMAVALNPGICTAAGTHYVDVEVAGALTRGMTVVDRLDVAGDERNREAWRALVDRVPRTIVCWAIDIPAFKSALFAALG
jgi:purine nucleosidase